MRVGAGEVWLTAGMGNCPEVCKLQEPNSAPANSVSGGLGSVSGAAVACSG